MKDMIFGDWTFTSNWDDHGAKLSKKDGSCDFALGAMFKGKAFQMPSETDLKAIVGAPSSAGSHSSKSAPSLPLPDDRARLMME